MEKVIIAFGSNQGDRKSHINNALELMSKSLIIDVVSSFYISKPLGFDSENDFLNGICECSTEMTPIELLDFLKSIEYEMGREYSKEGYQDRIIDLDIISYGNLSVNTKDLIIPHKLYNTRPFVLLPMLEVSCKSNYINQKQILGFIQVLSNENQSESEITHNDFADFMFESIEYKPFKAAVVSLLKETYPT
jgi:2-amino-4-hydroxy-6-hydroxymethyldihydropteridine diphosphokinase